VHVWKGGEIFLGGEAGFPRGTAHCSFANMGKKDGVGCPDREMRVAKVRKGGVLRG